MTKKSLNERVAQLETELSELKQRLPPSGANWRSIVGVFADDPAFEEAMQLGRAYRESRSLNRKQEATKKGAARGINPDRLSPVTLVAEAESRQ